MKCLILFLSLCFVLVSVSCGTGLNTIDDWQNSSFLVCTADGNYDDTSFRLLHVLTTDEFLGQEDLFHTCVLGADDVITCSLADDEEHAFKNIGTALSVDIGHGDNSFSKSGEIWLGQVTDNIVVYLKPLEVAVTTTDADLSESPGDNILSGHHVVWGSAACTDDTAASAVVPTAPVDTTPVSTTPDNPTITSIAVTAVSLVPSQVSLTIGDVLHLIAHVAPANATNISVTWASSDDSVATVDSNGVVQAIANGTATITVTTGDGSFTATSLITVAAPPSISVASVSITDCPTSSVSEVAADFTLDTELLPTNATNQTVLWASSDTSVADVDANSGLISLNAIGHTYITVSSVDGAKKDTCELKVDSDANVARNGVVHDVRPWFSTLILIIRQNSSTIKLSTFTPGTEDGFLHGFDMLQWPIDPTPPPNKPSSVIVVIGASSSKVTLIECLQVGPTQCTNHSYNATITWATPPADPSLPGVGAKIIVPSHGLEATWNGSRFETPSGEKVNRVCPTLGTDCP